MTLATTSRNVPRYALLMALGVFFNLGLYEIAHIFHLPIWMDCVGTAYVAVALEPAAGLIVAFATNFFESAAVYGVSSLVYYFVGALAALCFGVLIRKDGVIRWRRILLCGGVYTLLGSLLSTLLTLWRTGGVSDSRWERYFAQMAADAGAPLFISCLAGVFVLKLADAAVMCVLVPALVCLTPKRLRNETLEECPAEKFEKARN